MSKYCVYFQYGVGVGSPETIECDSLADVKDGFWMVSRYDTKGDFWSLELTKGSDAETWIPPGRISHITKL